MRVRVLHAKLYAFMRRQARQLDSSTELDRPRQLDAPAHGVSLDRLDRLDRQGLDNRLDSASTEPRQLDSSTARAQVISRPALPGPGEYYY